MEDAALRYAPTLSYSNHPPANTILEGIARLRSLTQISIQAGWRFCDADLSVAEAFQLETWQNWSIAELNAKGHLPWSKGQKTRWFCQTITVPHDLQGYPLQGLCLRIALTWWAEGAQIFVNGQLVQEGDLFDCSTRLLLSDAVVTGEEIAIALRLISPGHDDGALVRSLCLYEAPDLRNQVSSSSDNELSTLSEQKPDLLIDVPEPSFIADELAVLQCYLEPFAPDQLELLAEAVSHIDWSLLPTPYSPLPTPHSPFDQSLAELRDRLLPLSDFIKQRTIKLLGHAHLDMAWLWTVSETWSAAERTFESVLKLQQEFPELIFCHSTPALYDWIEQNRPELFKRIQQQVRTGVWEPIGGLWVEPELNIISGESIVRHVLYGQRYFQEKFGSISPIAWLPDSFGFNWQLPQLLKQGGIDYFVTQKLRWNDTTKFPYEVFKWRSPDGTEVFSLMSAPIGEGIDPVKMATYACEWEEKTGIPTSLWLPGMGDHGGGPTRDMLEVARRWQKSPFFPRLEFTSALGYLREIEKGVVEPQRRRDAEKEVREQGAEGRSQEPEDKNLGSTFADRASVSNLSASEVETSNLELETSSLELQISSSEHKTPRSEHKTSRSEHEVSPLELKTSSSELKTQNFFQPLPIWNSDLYLEFHRGCYTTHADQKLYNRHSEELLYQAELWASLATISTGVEYPKAELETAWKKVLFNQFHDILPGSSITEVFEDANRAWKEVYEISCKIRDQSYRAIAQQIAFPPPPHPDAQAVVVFNPRNWKQSRRVMAPTWQENSAGEGYGWQVRDLEGQSVRFQECSRNPANPCKWITFLAEDIPAIGYRCFWLCPYELQPSPITSSFQQSNIALVLENEFLHVTIDPETGDLASVFDKIHQREVLSGPGNQLQAFQDRDQYWDAWNIDPDYAQHPLPPAKLLSIYCRRTSRPLQQHICVDRAIGEAKFKQTYTLHAFSNALEIDTLVVFWHGCHVMVKAAFPLNLEASFATYEIPCGVIERSTQPQTDAEKAKWEVPALRWADLSDHSYGVSLLNDCKYGYDIQANRIRLTLLRGSTWPDLHAETMQPGFTYLLYPHGGSWQSARTVHLGYELNQPNMGYWSLLVKFSSGQYSTSGTLAPAASLLDLGADNLVLTAFKQSEDSPDEWILRCYECHGESAQLHLQSDLNLNLEGSVDLLERAIDAEIIQGQTATVHSWQIASFRVTVNKVL